MAELLALRAAVDALLPATDLGDLNLDQELVRQYLVTKAFQSEALTDYNTPANQKAQVLNSCAGILDALVETQAKFYKQERFKKIERALIQELRKWPSETSETFINDLAKALEEEK